MMLTTASETKTKLNQRPFWRYYGWLAVALLVATLLGYAWLLNSFFVADDYFLLRQSQAGWSLFTRADFAFYRPLTLLTWWLTFQVEPLQPWLYHVVNLALHLVNSLLIAVLINLLAGHRRYGWLAALLFCVYPAHPEAVTWLAGRFDVLATTGELLSFIFLLKFWKQWQELKTQGIWLWLGAALLCYWLALLSKEAAIFLPLMAVFYLFLESFVVLRLPRKKAIWLIANVTGLYLLVTGLYFGLRFVVLGGFGSYTDADYNFLNFGVWATAAAYNVLVAPVNQLFLAGHKTLSLLLIIGCHLLYWSSLFFLVVQLLLTKNARLLLLLLVGTSWSILAIEPALTVPYIRTGWKIADLEGSRVLYAASMGVCLLLAVAIIEVSDIFKKVKIICPVIATFVTLFYLGLLLINNWPWLTAGQQAQQIKQEFAQVKTLAVASGHDLTQPEAGVGIILQGLPDNYKGAYVARNMFGYQNNLGAVFYNLHIPAAQLESGQPLPDFGTLDFKTLYIIKFDIVKNEVRLQMVQKLDKGKTPQILLGTN